MAVQCKHQHERTSTVCSLVDLALSLSLSNLAALSTVVPSTPLGPTYALSPSVESNYTVSRDHVQ